MRIITITEFKELVPIEKIEVMKDICREKVKIKEEEKTMPKINVIEIRVREILETYPETRSNDNLLYVKYIKEYHYIDFNEDTFINYEEYGLPSYKSIERARRKIQNEKFVCRASETVENERKEAEKQYQDYYRR